MKPTEFKIQFISYGHYRVIYTSPKTGREWSRVTDNTPLIDAVKGVEDPRQKDMEMLKKLCKRGYI